MQQFGRLLDIDVDPFQPRFPWIGSDLQTIRSSIFIEPGIPEDMRLTVPVPAFRHSDQAISVALNKPAGDWNGKLVILNHGLGGTEGSGYMRRSCRYFLDKGWAVARVNMRGAGKSAETSVPPYHAGLTDDLRAVTTALKAEVPDARFFLMGFSLGGQLTLRFLAENDFPVPIEAAVSVSAPIHLATASETLSKRRNRPYINYLVKQLKRDLRKAPHVMDEAALEQVSRISHLDEQLVAPIFGYRDRFDYYEKTSVNTVMKDIKTPTLAIHAADDPWIPAHHYKQVLDGPHDHLTILLMDKGGHLGFFGRKHKINWFIPVADRYFKQLD